MFNNEINAARNDGKKERKMKYMRFFAIALLIVAVFSFVACGGNNNYVKDHTASLKSDDEDYFVPNIYIDVEKQEGAHLGGDKYGQYIPINPSTTKPNVDPTPDPDAIVPVTPEEIIDALYALEVGETLGGDFTLAGEIVSLDGEGKPTIVIDGFEDNPIYCFDLSVNNAIGDIITVGALRMSNSEGAYQLIDCIFICEGYLDFEEETN